MIKWEYTYCINIKHILCRSQKIESLIKRVAENKNRARLTTNRRHTQPQNLQVVPLGEINRRWRFRGENLKIASKWLPACRNGSTCIIYIPVNNRNWKSTYLVLCTFWRFSAWPAFVPDTSIVGSGQSTLTSCGACKHIKQCKFYIILYLPSRKKEATVYPNGLKE